MQELLPSLLSLLSMENLKSQIGTPRSVADSGEDQVILDLGHLYVQFLYRLAVF